MNWLAMLLALPLLLWLHISAAQADGSGRSPSTGTSPRPVRFWLDDVYFSPSEEFFVRVEIHKSEGALELAGACAALAAAAGAGCWPFTIISSFSLACIWVAAQRRMRVQGARMHGASAAVRSRLSVCVCVLPRHGVVHLVLDGHIVNMSPFSHISPAGETTSTAFLAPKGSSLPHAWDVLLTVRRQCYEVFSRVSLHPA